MPRDITVTFGDGSTHVYRGAPDNVTPEQVAQRAQGDFGKQVASLDGGRAAASKGSRDGAGKTAKDYEAEIESQKRGGAEGVFRSFAGVGNTLLGGVKWAADKLGAEGTSNYLQGLRQAQDDLDTANKENSAYGRNKLVTDIALTAPVGGAISQGLAKIPGVAEAAPRLLEAIRSGGMSLGGAAPAAQASAATTPAALKALVTATGKGTVNALTRAAGGGITGGASAGLIDPEQAKTGAGIGAALPVGASALGAAGRGAAKMFRGPESRAADALAKALDAATPAQRQVIIDKLRAAEELVPGSSPTVAQTLRTPQSGILERVVSDTPGGVALKERYAAQAAARNAALEQVAPTSATGAAQARQDFGEALARRVKPEEAAVSKRVTDMYKLVDPNELERLAVPTKEMDAAVKKYFGPGSFGASPTAREAAQEAAALAKPPPAPDVPQILGANGLPLRPPAPPDPRRATWEEVSRLRASLNQALDNAKLEGDRTALGALTAQKKALDQSIEQGLTPAAKNQFTEANASHAAKEQRFLTGPQADIFRKSPNGEALVQGGEVAAKFWGNRPGLADDVKAFRRLIDDNPDMLGQFRSMVTTEGAGTANASGNLGPKFAKWVEQHLPGLREAFPPEKLQLLERIADDINRAEAGAAAGMSRGSNTYQNAANALNLGLLDSPLLSAAANRVPLVRHVAGPGLQVLRDTARKSQAGYLANLLNDPEAAAAALTAAGAPPNAIEALLRIPGATAVRVAPALAANQR